MSDSPVTSPVEFTVIGPHGPLFVSVWPGDPEQTPLLLLHDSLGAVSLWRDFPKQLAARTGRQVVAYDRAGFGRSVVRNAHIASDFIMAEAHEGILPVLDTLDIQKVVLLGHSVGGGMALSAASILEERVAGVVTLSGQAFVEDRTLQGVRDAKVTFAQEGQVERLSKYHGERAKWVLSAWIDTWLDPSFADWSLDEPLRQIKVPVLAMHGAEDEFGSLKHPEMIAGLTGGRCKVFEGVGHMPHKEATEEVLAEVQAFTSAL